PRPIVAPAVKLSDRVRPLQPKPAEPRRQTFDTALALSLDGVAKPPRAEQEPILVRLIESTPDSEPEEKSDYYFRLGELYGAQHRFWRLKTAELIARKASQQEVQSATGKTKEALLKAVKTFKNLSDNAAFINYPKMDVALFEYGYVLYSGKYMAEARAVFDKLVKNYPASKYIPEAHFVFGDYYFE